MKMGPIVGVVIGQVCGVFQSQGEDMNTELEAIRDYSQDTPVSETMEEIAYYVRKKDEAPSAVKRAEFENIIRALKSHLIEPD